MGWLKGAGAPAVTGARWSAGALWADAGAPAGTDTDWEDAGDWPRAYDPDAQLTLGVFVQGVDITEAVHSLSWGLGQADIWSAGMSVSSASIGLRADHGEAGDRVVVLTEVDVLWSGRVETPASDEAPGVPTLYTLECSDDLARAGLADVALSAGGTAPSAIARLLQAAGVLADVAYVQAAGPHDIPLELVEISGQALGAITDMAEAANAAIAWAPAGVVLYPRSYRVLAADHVQLLGPAGQRRSRSRDVKDVRNAWYIGAQDVDSVAELLTDADSIDAYGRRSVAFDYPDHWSDSGSAPGSGDGAKWPADYYRFAADTLGEPPERLQSSVLIKGGADTIHRVLPLEVTAETFGTYMITRVAHQVDVERWTMTLAGVAVLAPSTQLLAHLAATEGLRDAWAFDRSSSRWLSTAGTSLSGAAPVASIIPDEDVLTARAGALTTTTDVGANLGWTTERDGAWSFSCWFVDDLADTLQLLELGDLAFIDATIKITTAGAVQIDSAGGGSGLFAGPAGSVSAGALHHILVRSSTAATTVYVDGVAVTPTSSAGWPAIDAPWRPSYLDLDSSGGIMLPALFTAYLADSWAAAHYALRSL